MQHSNMLYFILFAVLPLDWSLGWKFLRLAAGIAYAIIGIATMWYLNRDTLTLTFSPYLHFMLTNVVPLFTPYLLVLLLLSVSTVALASKRLWPTRMVEDLGSPKPKLPTTTDLQSFHVNVTQMLQQLTNNVSRLEAEVASAHAPNTRDLAEAILWMGANMAHCQLWQVIYVNSGPQ